MKYSLAKKITSQSVKKSQKNQARLPRTAGLRTLSELTTELTKAGLDPSRIQARAEMLAKLQGAERKRKRQQDEAEDSDGDVDMDMDGEGEGGDDGWEDDGMDVDEDDTPKRKKAKRNDGAVSVVVAGGKGPRTDRRLAGMRDEGVSVFRREYGILLIFFKKISKQIVLSNYAILDSGPGICWQRPEKRIVISGQRWCV
jgi:nucleolar GTP-binding protein